MIVKAIYKDKEHNYFRDKTTAPEIENQVKREYGQVFECDDELAKERIEKGLVIEASEEEQKAYVDSLDTIDEEDLNKEESQEEIIETIVENNKIETEDTPTETPNFEEMKPGELSKYLNETYGLETRALDGKVKLMAILKEKMEEGKSDEE